MSDAQRINGNQYDWASIEVKVAGVPYYGVTAINFSQTRERTMFYGLGKHHAPRGRGRGQYSCEASMEMWADAAESLREALDDGTGNYGDTVFDITVQYVEPGTNAPPVIVELFQCVIGGEEASNAQGTDGLKENIPLSVMYIKKNGRSLFFNEGAR